jgi:hypothetical protein
LEAGNISARSIAGTYVFADNGVSSVLVIKPDHTYKQQFVHQGDAETVEGTWRLFGEAGIAFSKSFMRLPGQTINQDGVAYGQVKNTFGFVSVTLAPNPGGPVLRKR